MVGAAGPALSRIPAQWIEGVENAVAFPVRDHGHRSPHPRGPGGERRWRGSERIQPGLSSLDRPGHKFACPILNQLVSLVQRCRDLGIGNVRDRDESGDEPAARGREVSERCYPSLGASA